MDTLLFNMRDELIRVSLRHVVYFEADGNYFLQMDRKPQFYIV